MPPIPAIPFPPFSPETADIRERDIQRFSAAREGSHLRLPDDLRPYLPKLVWPYQMGLILFWAVIDRWARPRLAGEYLLSV